jgi:4-hydroxy-tetrahydrodipicolinate synthase
MVHASVLAATIAQEKPSQQAALEAAIEQFRARTGVDRIFLRPIKRLQDRWWAVPQPNRTPVCLDRRQFDRREPPNGTQHDTQQIWRFQRQSAMLMAPRLEVIPMPRHKTYVPHGVIPAVLLPFDADLAIDEAGFRKHLRDVAATPGITAITVNAHSTEVASCSFEEQRRVLAIAEDEIGDRLPLVNGVWADGSIEAARIARMAAEGGASALLIFPPAPFTLGQSPEMALAHVKRIADATDLPLVVFQYPLATGQGYPRDTLLKMVDEVASIRAIKDWAGNVPQHEMHIRTLQSLPRPVNVLTTHSAWLLSSLVLGCNGLLSGSGSVIPDLQAQLFHAVKANDLAEARRLNDRIYPLARVFYADPWADMHNRMKEALVLLGRLPRAVVRPPLVKLSEVEIDRIRAALVEAGLLGSKARRDAA